MIKFKYLYHKPTKSLIEYNEWLKVHKQNLNMMFIEQQFNPYTQETYTKEMNKYKYLPLDMLVSEDFEILYDSYFTEEELHNIDWELRHNCYSNQDNVLNKIRNYCSDMENIYYKTGKNNLNEV